MSSSNTKTRKNKTIKQNNTKKTSIVEKIY